MNGWLDGLLGAIKNGATALTKRNVLRVSTGLAAADDADAEETVLTATGTVLGGQTVGTLSSALLGWFLGYSGTAWVPVKGLREVGRGTFTMSAGSSGFVSCPGIAAGDFVVWAPSDETNIMAPLYCNQVKHSTGEFVMHDDSSTDDSTYNWVVIRLASLPPV